MDRSVTPTIPRERALRVRVVASRWSFRETEARSRVLGHCGCRGRITGFEIRRSRDTAYEAEGFEFGSRGGAISPPPRSGRAWDSKPRADAHDLGLPSHDSRDLLDCHRSVLTAGTLCREGDP